MMVLVVRILIWRTLMLTKCAEIWKQKKILALRRHRGINIQQLCSDPSVAPQGGVGGLLAWRQESTRGGAVRRKSTTPMSYYPLLLPTPDPLLSQTPSSIRKHSTTIFCIIWLFSSSDLNSAIRIQASIDGCPSSVPDNCSILTWNTHNHFNLSRFSVSNWNF